MGVSRKSPAFGIVGFFTIIFMLATYFTFASVQGDYGLFRRIQIEAELTELTSERDRLQSEVAQMRNKTHRLSDDYLDLDLLDEQARDVLGLVRMDEIVIR
ncbi:MAG: septum formation initiator family protein [Marinosulfonomonas sp.]|nr:septum formation initiator family protein [Marinosulfonomonas sp.]